MSLEPKKTILSAGFVQNALKSYLPPRVVDRIPGINTDPNVFDTVYMKSFLEPIFEKSEFEMRRYGSIEELTENLEAFINFTGAHYALQAHRWEPFTGYPVIYKSLRRKMYMNKQDVFVHLQNLTLEKFAMGEDFALIVLAAYLKFHEEKLASCCEFVRIDDDRFISIIKYIDERVVMSSLPPSGDQKGFTFENILKRIKKLIPDWNEAHFGIEAILGNMCEESPPEVYPDLYRCILYAAETVVDACEVIINARPTIFCPNSFTPLVNHPVVIRLFEDGQKRFVMREELNRVVPVESGGNHCLLTTDVKEALRLIANQSVQVELLITPIIRTKHSALPIRTPGNRHCKLAGDLFLELLQDFIFGTMIFQKLKHNEWPRVAAVLGYLQEHFTANIEDVYFLEVSMHTNTITWPVNAQEIVARPAKHVRNAKADGFTVQNLKNEMTRLGLLEAFPDINDFAEVVYDHVSKVKKEPVLRTCDLFDAIEQCQLICLFKKMPELTRFLHNQNCCHRVLITDCCSKPEKNGPRFAKSQWKSIHLEDVEFMNVFGDGEFRGITEKTLTCRNNPQLFYNDTSINAMLDRTHIGRTAEEREEMLERIMSTGPRKVFLLDREELAPLLDFAYADLFTESDSLKSLQAYVKRHKKKKIYLRTIAWSPINRENERQIFVEELKDMLPVLLEQQGDSVDYGKIDAYWREHFAKDPPCPEMMRLDKLERVLKDFDINKAVITLVPDIAYALAVINQVPASSGNRMITIYGPNREPLVHKHQAIFKIFQDVVCDVDWSRRDAVKIELRKQILQKMKQFLSGTQLLDPGSVEECVSQLKKTRGYLEQKKKKKLTPLIKLFDCDFNDTVNISFFLDECEAFGISYHGTKKLLDEAVIPAWKARLLFLVEWNEKFIGGELELRKVIQTGIYHRTPLIHWDSEDDFLDVILYKTRKKTGCARMLEFENVSVFDAVSNHEWLENTSWKDRPYINRFKKWEVRDRIWPFISCPENMVVGAMQVKREADRIRRDLVNQEEKIDEVERRSLELLTEILEGKVGTRDKDAENVPGKMKSQVPLQANETRNKKEIVGPRESANCEKCFRTSRMCKQAKEEAAGLQSQVDKLKKRLAAAEKELKERKLEGEQTVSALKLKVVEQEEASESAKKENEQLKCKNVELEVGNSEKDRIIRLLKSQIPKETLGNLEIEKTTEMKRVFVDLQEKSNELKSSYAVGNAMKQMHTLFRMNDKPMVRRRVEYEMLRFRVDFQKYSTAIEQNIERIKEDALITREELIPIPELPVLPEEILEEFRKAQEAKNQQIDKECVICFKGFTKKTKKAYKCSGCRKKFHVDCVKDWWERKTGSRECPHCKVRIDVNIENLE